MTSREEVTLPATRPRSRKSLAHIPSSIADQENVTADIGSLAGGKKPVPIEKASKKSRSKSIGPGGLDALKDTSGNRRKVWLHGHLYRITANITQVSGRNSSSSSKIDPETNDAPPSRNPSAYFI